MVAQVLRAENRLPLGRDGAHQRDGRLLHGERTRRVGEPLRHREHERRVEGPGHPQTTYGNALAVQVTGGALDRGDGTGEDLKPRTVVRRDGEVPAASGTALRTGSLRHQRRDGLLAPTYGDHGPGLGERPHETAAFGGEPHGVPQGQHPAHTGCGDLPDTVPGHRVGLHTPLAQLAGECDPGGDEQRLRHLGEGLVGSVGLRGEGPLHQGPPPYRPEEGGRLVEGVAEQRSRTVQSPVPARELRPCPGNRRTTRGRERATTPPCGAAVASRAARSPSATTASR